MNEIKKIQVENICKRLNANLINYKFLAKGNHNMNYLLETTNGKFILKIENNLQFKNLKKEYKILRTLSKGFGPEVFLFDSSHKIIINDYLIEEFIRGKHPSNKPSNDFVISMAKFLKKLHQKTKKSSGYYVKSAIRPYYDNYSKYKHYMGNKDIKIKLEILMNKGLILAKKNDKLFTDRKTLSFLHNDTSRENIFYNNKNLKLIDWEFAEWGLPERELVYFVDSYKLSKKQISLFLKCYEYPNTIDSNKQLYISYLVLLFSSIGYSLWRLSLAKDSKLKKEANTRLLRDIKLLEKLLNGQIF